MKWLRSLAVIALVCTGCYSYTSPNTTLGGLWGYQASTLTDGVVLCSIAVPMSLLQADTTFTGDYTGSFMTCSAPTGATSTLASGTVSGTVSPSTMSFSFQNTQVYNYGSIDGTVVSNTNVGTHLASQSTFEGTTTMDVIIDGVPHALTGTFVARAQ